LFSDISFAHQLRADSEENGDLPNAERDIISQCRRGFSGAWIDREGEALEIHTLLYDLFSFLANRLTLYSTIVENCDSSEGFG